MQTSKNEEKARIVITREDGTKFEYVSSCDYFPNKNPVYFFQTYLKAFGRERVVFKTSSLEIPI